MEKLRTYCNSKSRREVAQALSVSQPYLSQLLTGARVPSLKMAFLIEEVTCGAVPVSAWKDGADD